MTEIDFRTRYQKDEPVLQAWGAYVTDYVIGEIEQHLGEKGSVANFLKTPSVPRVKSLASLVSKAFYRGYEWIDPYTEITDKVGSRFVVLLLKEIDVLSNIVRGGPDWTCEQSRDFEKDKRENPTIFAYQSVHFIVKANKCLHCSGIMIPEDTPCEVQIRTLMQHAFSEMSHDTVYKPQIKASPDLYRLMARCVALIETTDEEFKEADVEISKVESNFEQQLTVFEQLYKETVHLDSCRHMQTCAFIYDKMKAIFAEATPDKVQRFVKDRPRLGETIKKHLDSEFLYTQPLILPLLYAIDSDSRAVEASFPYLHSRLEPMLVDMGIGSS
jgi:putative GTP pyrophosphokinase